MKDVLRTVLSGFMLVMGVLHFGAGPAFARTIPRALPAPLALVYVSGIFELLGGLGLLVPEARPYAAWGLVALFVAVFPANLNMAIHHIGFGPRTPSWLLWARLPLQPVLIAWAYWYT